MTEEKDLDIQDDNKPEEINANVEKEPKEAAVGEEPVETPKDKTEQDDNHTDKKSRKIRNRHASEKIIEELKEKNEELNDKYLRLFSEFDNYRKRTAKEKIDMLATASSGVIKELLPVLDDFERAIQNMEKNGNEADLQGVTLIQNKLKTALRNKGLEEIEAMGADFNTDEHEALTTIPATDETQKGKVVDVIQKGYRLNGQVLRFARVVVGN